MPSKSPLYNNATLAAQEKARKFTGPGEGITIRDLEQAVQGVPGRNNVDPADPGVGGDPLAEAKAFRERPNRFEPNVRDIADMDARLDWNNQNAQMEQDIAQQRKGAFRRGTEAAASLGGLAQLASIPTLAMPAVAGGLAVGGTLATLPDQLRRAYMPQEDETEPTAMEAGMTGLGLLPGVGMMMRTAAKGAQAASAADDLGRAGARLRKTFNVRQAEELPYRMGGSRQPQNPAWERFIRPERPQPPSPYASAADMQTPHAEASIARGFRQNNPIAREVLGDQVKGSEERLREIAEQWPSRPRIEAFEGSGPEAAFHPTQSIEAGAGWNTPAQTVPTARSLASLVPKQHPPRPALGARFGQPEITQPGKLKVHRAIGELERNRAEALRLGDTEGVKFFTDAINQQQMLRRQSAKPKTKPKK